MTCVNGANYLMKSDNIQHEVMIASNLTATGGRAKTYEC